MAARRLPQRGGQAALRRATARRRQKFRPLTLQGRGKDCTALVRRPIFQARLPRSRKVDNRLLCPHRRPRRLASPFCASHLAALFRATATCLRTDLAMLELVLCALRSARLADVGARLTDLGRKCAISGCVVGCKATDSCAIHVQAYALRHHLDVVLLQGRVVATPCARRTPEVLLVDTTNLRQQRLIALQPWRPPLRIGLAGLVLVVLRRGDRQLRVRSTRPRTGRDGGR